MYRALHHRWPTLWFISALLLALASCGGKTKVGSVSTTTPVPAPSVAKHYVDLRWTPSASAVLGYNIYRGTQSGGPYAKINLSPHPVTAYSDQSVQSGSTYYYVTTAVNSLNMESTRSNETVAEIPAP